MKRWQLIFGIFLVTWGVVALAEALFHVDLWRFVGPLLLVALGLLLIFRPKMAGPGIHVEMPFIGDVRKEGAWEATQHEIWLVVGTNRLDFTEAIFPTGEASIKVFGFVTEVKVTLSADVGLRVETAGFVSEVKTRAGEQDRMFGTLAYETPNYFEAEKRVNLQTIGFVNEIKINQADS